MSAVKEVQGPAITAPPLGLAGSSHVSVSPGRADRLRLRMLGVAALLALVGLLLVTTGSPVGAWNAVLAIVLDTALAVALASIAAMSWVRYRERGPVRVLYQCSAFAVLAAGSLVSLGLIVAMPSAVPGGIIDAMAATQWLLAGVLFVLGTRSAAQTKALTRRPAWLLALGPAGALALGSLIAAVASAERAAGDAWSFLAPAQLEPGLQIGIDPVHASVHVLAMLVLLVGAARYERLYAASPHASQGWLAMGLVWAAGAQLFAILAAVEVPLVVTIGDLCSVVFIACSMIGVVAASQSNLRSLHRAYEELRVAREEEVRRAAFAERARLARDIHDHLIQSLWLARLRQGHVLETELPPESRALADEVCRALDEGLADAREAMIALDPGPDGARPIHLVLREGVARLADRYELDLRLSRSGAMPTLDPPIATQLLGIAREALTNSAKHADATVVRLRLVARPDALVMSIADNGNGFDPGTASDGYGLSSMRRRAETIGAELSVESRHMDGTRVTVSLPVATVREP